MHFLNCSYIWWIVAFSCVQHLVYDQVLKEVCFMNEGWCVCFPLGSLPFVKPVLSCHFVFPGKLRIMPRHYMWSNFCFLCLCDFILWAVSCCKKWPTTFLIMLFHIMLQHSKSPKCLLFLKKKKRLNEVYSISRWTATFFIYRCKWMAFLQRIFYIQTGFIQRECFSWSWEWERPYVESCAITVLWK